MKRQKDAIKKTATTAKIAVEKVSLRESMSVFSGIKFPIFLMAAAVVLSILNAILNLNVAAFSGSIVDASGDIPIKDLMTYIFSSVVAAIVYVGACVTQSIASEKINYQLRVKIWKKILVTRQSEYGADNGEEMVSRITSDCDYASKYFTTILAVLALAVNLIVYVSGMYKLNIQMANYVLIYIPVTIILGWIFSALSYIVTQRVQVYLAKSTAYLIERTRNLPLIKTCNAQKKEIEDGQRHFKGQFDAQMRSAFVTAFGTVLDTVFQMLSIAIPFILGAAMVIEGKISLGVVVSFSTLYGSVRTVFTNIITNAGTFNGTSGALARITHALKNKEEDISSGANIPEDEEDIKFVGVNFSYTDRPILKDVSFTIPKNKVTAIVGGNGSGKSTTFNLLERLYEPNDGEIQYGTENVRNYNLNAWRRRFTAVSQGAPLLAGTIRENMCYGRTDGVSEEELMSAAVLSHSWDFIKELPNGFDTEVAAGGENFSGGQKQCIAIARAMLNKRDYILLDEATSSLDAKREKDVTKAIGSLFENRTCVIIAHHIKTIKHADHVIVLNNGVIEAEGSPEIILQKTNNYLSKIMARAESLNAEA